MLVIDMEATGLDPVKNSVVSIGAVDFYNPENQFYEECRVFDGAYIDTEALMVNGFTKAQCLDPNKKSLEKIMGLFHEWIKKTKGDKILAGQNAYYDRDILNNSFERSDIDFRFHFRILELHSVAFMDMLKRGITPPKRNGISALSLDKILNYVGLPNEPAPHNALTGAKVEAEAISRILNGKNLLKEFAEFEVPDKFLK